MPIGREREFEILVDAARDAAGGRGSIVFVDGPVGSGKSFLLNALAEDCRSSERKQRLETVSVRCYETSAGNPLGPFGEVLRALTSRERRGDRAKRILELVGNVAPSLLELIPVVGKLAAVGLKAASDVGVYALGGDHEGQQAQLASDVALTLDAIAAEIPLLIVIDDAQWIDAPSTEVIVRLAEGVANRGLLLLIAYDRALVDDRHPLVRVRSALLRRAGVSKIVLANFGVEEVETVLRDRYGDVPGKGLAEWLLDLTDGSPLFVQQYLATLEEQGVLRLCDGAWVLDGTIEGGPGDWRLHGGLVKAQTPDTLLELLRPRVADLDDEERALLQTGAVQGRRFLSAVIAKQLDREEDEILDRLDQLQQRRQMITIDQTEDWWSDRSNLYAFDPGTVQELLYGRYARSAYERRRRHRAVAQVLETLIAEDHPPPRQALLEIARHYEAAGDPLASARRLVDVADSTFAEGADRETAANAERAVTLLRTALLGAPDHDRLEVYRPLARAIILLLLAGESSWHPEATDTRGARLLGLAKEATRVADAVGDPALRASARYAAALVLISHRGLQEGIASFREALELARLAGDQVAEFAILINLGHHLDSVRLEEGWNVLQDAQALLMEPALAVSLGDATLVFETARLETRLGVAAFDLGRYGEAIELLVRSSQAMRMARRREEAAWAMAFLGQVYTAIGLYEAAEATLREGIALFVNEPGSNGIRGYLRSLLGHVDVEREPPQYARAREEMVRANDEVIAAALVPVAPIVQSYWAELLLADGTPEALREADSTLAAGTTFGWARSEITANSLRARIAVAERRVHDAVRLSNSAVQQLSDRGGAVPATRSEEILLTHAQVLDAAGSDETSVYLAKAAEIVRAKADSLTDAAQRNSFLERVRLSVTILTAAEQSSAAASDR